MGRKIEIVGCVRFGLVRRSSRNFVVGVLVGRSYLFVCGAREGWSVGV